MIVNKVVLYEHARHTRHGSSHHGTTHPNFHPTHLAMKTSHRCRTRQSIADRGRMARWVRLGLLEDEAGGRSLYLIVPSYQDPTSDRKNEEKPTAPAHIQTTLPRRFWRAAHAHGVWLISDVHHLALAHLQWGAVKPSVSAMLRTEHENNWAPGCGGYCVQYSGCRNILNYLLFGFGTRHESRRENAR